MDLHMATEIAYKNGYEAGTRDALLKISTSGGSMSKREFGEPIRQYIVEEDTLVKLFELWHRKECGDREPFEYFWDMMAESGCEQHVSHREFVKAVENMTFEKLAEMDLGLYEEYKEKCGNECQFKFRARTTEEPIPKKLEDA